MGLTPRRVELHIEHLELEGVDVRDAAAVAAALRAGLAGHLMGALPAGWTEGASVEAIDAGPIAFDRNPTTLGARAADAVARGWAR